MIDLFNNVYYFVLRLSIAFMLRRLRRKKGLENLGLWSGITKFEQGGIFIMDACLIRGLGFCVLIRGS